MGRMTFSRLEQVGRLGNQLWQIASTVGIARREGMEPVFPRWSYEPWFSCPPEWFTDDLSGAVEAEHVATSLPPKARPYLQDLALWAACADEVRRVFAPSGQATETLDRIWDEQFDGLARPITAVHVRMGDYVTNPPGTMNPVPWRYYTRALGTLDGTGSTVVFSDDPAACRKRLRVGADLFYVGKDRPTPESGDYDAVPVLDWIDMQLMARCDQHVISNSTYSWWGAWLAGNPEPRYPSVWYGKRMRPAFDIKLAIPRGWVKVTC